MPRDTISLAELLDELGSHKQVFYRLMVRREETGWTVQAMMVDTHLNSRTRFVYDYGYVAFVGRTGKGSLVASWLKNRKGRVANFKFVIPQLQENVVSNRYPSHTKREMFLSLPEPYSVHQIHIPGRVGYQHAFDPLVKSGCPSFPNLGDAAYEFLYGLEYRSVNREPDDIIVRIAHTEAWLELVQLHRTAVSISICGSHISGTRLELRGDPNNRFDAMLRRPGIRRFSFPQGLPERLFVVLSRKDRWLDYQEISLRGSASARGGGVVVDAPDLCSQVQGLIARGESETREFKREMPRDKNNTFLKTVAAFANGKGGVVLFGVVDETGDLKGIAGDLQEQKDRAINMIRDNVVPQPNLRVENCKLKGKQIIAVFVDEGDSPPYGLDAAKPRFYIRRGATTFPANQAEIRGFAKKFGEGLQAYSVDPFG